MGSFTEIELDLSYLDDLEEIIVHDECGGDDVSFYREGLLASDNAKLRGLLKTAMTQTERLCSTIHPNCHTCPLHHGHDECSKVMVQNDAREFGIKVKE